MPENKGIKVEEYEVLTVSDGEGTVQARFNSPKDAVVSIQGTCKYSLMKSLMEKIVEKHPDVALG
jgi:hypothetical protein